MNLDKMMEAEDSIKKLNEVFISFSKYLLISLNESSKLFIYKPTPKNSIFKFKLIKWPHIYLTIVHDNQSTTQEHMDQLTEARQQNEYLQGCMTGMQEKVDILNQVLFFLIFLCLPSCFPLRPLSCLFLCLPFYLSLLFFNLSFNH